MIIASFWKYGSVDESIADHSAYLKGALNQGVLRYPGLEDCRDYRRAAQIIKDGGYATDPDYVAQLCVLIERWGLDAADKMAEEETADLPAGKTGAAEEIAGKPDTARIFP